MKQRRAAGIFVVLLAALAPGVAHADADVYVAARALERGGRHAEAEDLASGVVTKGGESAFAARAVIVRTRLARGLIEGARRAADEMMAAAPGSARALVLAAECARQVGDLKEARALWKRAAAVAAGPVLDADTAAERAAVGVAALAGGADPRRVFERHFEPAAALPGGTVAPAAEVHLPAARAALTRRDVAVAASWLERARPALDGDPAFHVAVARAHERDQARASAAIERALALDPRHTEALVLRALQELEGDGAPGPFLDRALAVDAGHPQAWALQAVAAELRGDAAGAAAARAKGLARAQRSPDVDTTMAEALSRRYRFAEAVVAARRALALDAGHLPAKRQLALDLLHVGDERAGFRLAAELHRADPYDVVAFNLTTLQRHMTALATLRRGPLTVRMDPDEAAVYGGDVLALLADAQKVLGTRYGHAADAPVTVEIFREQGDFATRTFGLPVVTGHLGVCFGPVVTATSPDGNGAAPVAWRSVLWHEYAHVVTLGRTRNRMPRWLSEGISVFEEGRRDPAYRDRLTPRFRDMILGADFVPVAGLAGAFLRPKSGEHVMFAYFEAGLFVEHFVARYGEPALAAVLDDLARGVPALEALAARSEPLPALEAGFRAFATARAKALPFDAAQVRGALSRADEQLAAGRAAAAIATLTPLAEIDAAAVQLARVHRAQGDVAAERRVLEALAGRTADAPEAFVRLVQLAEAAGDTAAVARHAAASLGVNPMAPGMNRRLADALAGDPAAAARAAEAYRRVLRLGAPDPAEVRFRLAALLQKSDPAAARRHVLDALAEAPRFREAHVLLRALAGRKAK